MSGGSESRRFLGGLLIALGVLIATLGGLCTFTFVTGKETGEALLVFGLLPLAVGLALAVAGFQLMESGRSKPSDAPGESSENDRGG